MPQVKTITTPLTEDIIAGLHCGDLVSLSGVIYTGRDAAHKLMTEALVAGRPIPVDLHNQIMYYAGPTPARPGEVIGSCGPTTSGRMDAYTPQLIEQAGLKGMIGKGPRDQATIDAIVNHHCVYFAAVGGAAALIASSVKECRVVAYDNLGPEALRYLVVQDYPCICAIDRYGNDLYKIGPSQYRLFNRHTD